MSGPSLPTTDLAKIASYGQFCNSAKDLSRPDQSVFDDSNQGALQTHIIGSTLAGLAKGNFQDAGMFATAAHLLPKQGDRAPKDQRKFRRGFPAS